MIFSWFSSQNRLKKAHAKKSRRRLHVELFEQRMLLAADAVDYFDTTTDMDDLSMAADTASAESMARR